MAGRRLTPLEIAKYIDDPLSEDPFAMPNHSGVPSALNQPGMMDQTGMAGNGYNAGPEFGDGQEQPGDSHTCVGSCGATSCANNCNGMCSLESVTINDRGGCEEYEAIAGDGMENGRYGEQDANITGGPSGPPDQSQQSDHNRWDPRGGGY